MEFEMLVDIIADVLSVDKDGITRETRFVEDLGADSLDVFQIIMGLEEQLNIEVDTAAAEGIKTVGDAADLIKATLGK